MTRVAPTVVSEADLPRAPRNAFDRYFKISERGSTLGREIRGGFATFFTLAYIVVLNPLILISGGVEHSGKDITGGYVGGVADPNVALGLVAAPTALVAGMMTIFMGVIGRYPIALAAGLGLNALVASLPAYMTWADAMGLVVIEGAIIALLVLTGFRTAVFHAIPLQLKTAISVGIGLFIAFIGFVDSGFVRKPQTAPVPVELGIGGRLQGWPTLVFAAGLVLTAILVARRTRGAILIGIVVTGGIALVVEAVAKIGPTVVTPPSVNDPDGVINPQGWRLNVPKLPENLDQVISIPDLSLFGQFNVLGSWQQVGMVATVMFIFTLLLADFFDTMGTIVGVGARAGLLNKRGQLPDVGRVLFVDSAAAVAGGAFSISSNTAHVESAAGVGEGARTGVANLVTGGLFLLSMFVAPLIQLVPFEAASPALVVVGFMMAAQIRNINFADYGIAIPAFLTMVFMPFSYSITNGIGVGFVSYVIIKLAQGRAREVHWLMWLVSLLFLIYFALAPVERLLGVSPV